MKFIIEEKGLIFHRKLPMIKDQFCVLSFFVVGMYPDWPLEIKRPVKKIDPRSHCRMRDHIQSVS